MEEESGVFGLLFNWDWMTLFWCFVLGLCVAILMQWGINKLHGNRNYRKSEPSVKTLIILGSGGHTREVLSLSRVLSTSFNPRVYVSTLSDELSLIKARELEQDRVKKTGLEVKFKSVVRIRDVGQSFISALLVRAPTAFLQSAILMLHERPDVLLCNGPGVCVPFCFIATALNMLRITSTKIIFVESICRVKTLSMTGRLLIRIAHEFIVQWKDLQVICQAQYPKSTVLFLGRLS